MAGNSSPPVLLKIMQQKLRDIEICRKCRFFHVENDPDNGHGGTWINGYWHGDSRVGNETFDAISKNR